MNGNLPDEHANEISNGSSSSIHEHKVVIKCGSGEVVKGYVECGAGADLAVLVERCCQDADGAITLTTLGDKVDKSILLRDVKAAFFVKSFRGDASRKAIRFYTNGPAVGSIWAEVRFKDDEVIEGWIENSVKYLADEGFFLKPSDFASNNLLVYINKSAISSFRVLGIRGSKEFGST